MDRFCPQEIDHNKKGGGRRWKIIMMSALAMLLHHEGGYINHPKDPGGETNLGVTKRVYEEYLGERLLVTR